METGSGDAALPLSQTRQVTIDALCEHFANDSIPMEEFERRVEVAHRAASVEELKELLRDLPGANVPAPVGHAAPAPAARPRPRVTAAAHEREQGFVVAIMGSATRKGRWHPARQNFVFALMGGTELDFREAVLPSGVTEVQIVTIMGGAGIIVPPGVNIESHGIGIMGGFDHVEAEHEYDPDAPTLRISGVALMGGVDIRIRHPGESSRDARRRQKQERKERRRLKDSWE